MPGFMQPQEGKSLLKDIPPDVSILPLRNTVAFPFMILPLSVGVPRSIKLVEETLQGNRLIGRHNRPLGHIRSTDAAIDGGSEVCQDAEGEPLTTDQRGQPRNPTSCTPGAVEP